jgi:hypothetical protein
MSVPRNQGVEMYGVKMCFIVCSFCGLADRWLSPDGLPCQAFWV